MKAILSIFTFFISLSLTGAAFAEQVVLDWENDLKLYINYDEATDSIDAAATIASERSLRGKFSLGIFVDGREYRKFFQYDTTSQNLYVQFDIPQTLRDDTRIFLSVKDAQYNELYTTVPTGFSASRSLTSNSNSQKTSVRSEFGTSTMAKDYGIFSMQVSRPQTEVKSTFSTPSSNTNKRVNVSDLTRSELKQLVESGDYNDGDIDEILDSIKTFEKIQNSVKPEIIPQQDNKEEMNSVQETRKRNDIQIYKTRRDQPRVINGIGNKYAQSAR